MTGVYGLNIVKIIPLDFDSAQAKDSVTKGESQLGEVGTTDGALASEGLTLLQDDKGDPARPEPDPRRRRTRPSSRRTQDVATLLNKALSATLTTADLAAMDLKVDFDRAKQSDVAKDYLTSKGLLS